MDSFITIAIILGIVAIYAIHSFRPNRLTDQDFIEQTFEPKPPTRLKVWLCKRHNHRGNAHHVIESKDGTHKLRCFGCNTVFLEGRKIKIILEKQ